MDSFFVPITIILIGGYLVYKSRKHDIKLDTIEIHVDGRLSEALEELKALRGLITTSQISGDPVPPPNGKKVDKRI